MSTTVKVVPSSTIASPFSSKTIIGAIIGVVGWLMDSHIAPADMEPVIRSIGDVLAAIGTLISVYGVWHGQQKVKQTIALNSPQPEPKVVP